MAIAWVTMRGEPHLIEAFRAAPWEIKAFSPAEFLQAKLSQPCDVEVIVFELLDGLLLDLCQEICHKRIAPMLIIVSNLVYAQAALEAGADDFLVEPIDPIEGLLRLHKLARTSNIIRAGDLEIDLTAWRVGYGSCRVRLTSVEFRLLACLAKRVGQTVSYAEIMEEVWGWETEYGTLAQVKNCVGRVRRKIEPDLHNPQYIITIPREGYRLRNQRQWKENLRETGRSNLILQD
jgi:DNA-binding response OmpR family regulator